MKKYIIFYIVAILFIVNGYAAVKKHWRIQLGSIAKASQSTQYVEFVAYYKHMDPEKMGHKLWTSHAYKLISENDIFNNLTFDADGHPVRTEIYVDHVLVLSSGERPSLLFNDNFENGEKDAWDYVYNGPTERVEVTACSKSKDISILQLQRKNANMQ